MAAVRRRLRDPLTSTRSSVSLKPPPPAFRTFPQPIPSDETDEETPMPLVRIALIRGRPAGFAQKIGAIVYQSFGDGVAQYTDKPPFRSGERRAATAVRAEGGVRRRGARA